MQQRKWEAAKNKRKGASQQLAIWTVRKQRREKMDVPNCLPVGAILICLLILLCSDQINSEELAPPYFNLADNRRIYASATCGEDTNGPEWYCKLVGSSAGSSDDDFNIIKGQVCIDSFKQI